MVILSIGFDADVRNGVRLARAARGGGATAGREAAAAPGRRGVTASARPPIALDPLLEAGSTL
jgi:hypothetical protein